MNFCSYRHTNVTKMWLFFFIFLQIKIIGIACHIFAFIQEYVCINELFNLIFFFFAFVCSFHSLGIIPLLISFSWHVLQKKKNNFYKNKNNFQNFSSFCFINVSFSLCHNKCVLFCIIFFFANDFLFGGFFFIPHPLDNHEQQQNQKEALVVCSFELKKEKSYT